jgi:hypothetical protein
MTHPLKFAALGIVFLALGPVMPVHALNVFTASGSAADILVQVDALRAAIGGANNGATVGPLLDGRREINWDGVPDSLSDPRFVPGDAFNAASGGGARGLVTSTPGAGFKTSAATGNTLGTPIVFDRREFAAFSAERIFSPFGSTETFVTFFVPGSPTTGATVSAFGVVLLGVNDAKSSRMQAFDAQGQQIGEVQSGVGNFSFVALSFSDGTRIASVRINSGDTRMGSLPGSSSADFVAMDDFIYSEPQALAAAVPEPASVALMLAGLAAMAGFVRRHRR